MMKNVIAMFIVVAIGATSATAKRIDWEKAKVIAQDVHSENAGAYAASIGNGTFAVPLYRTSNNVTLETSDAVYQLIEMGSPVIILPVNGEIQFYRDGEFFVVLDKKNKKHKFGLQGMTSKPKQP